MPQDESDQGDPPDHACSRVFWSFGMSKNLFILRHAKSDWDDSTLDDYDRPLNPRGRMAAPRMGLFLGQESLIPDRILCSTAARAQQTALLTLTALSEQQAAQQPPETLHWPSPIQYLRELYMAKAEEILSILRLQKDTDTCLMIIGHNPGLEKFIDSLCITAEEGLKKKLSEKFPTAGFAKITAPIEKWKDLRFGKAHLENLVYPKDL